MLSARIVPNGGAYGGALVAVARQIRAEPTRRSISFAKNAFFAPADR
jgi:hypothetical protein